MFKTKCLTTAARGDPTSAKSPGDNGGKVRFSERPYRARTGKWIVERGEVVSFFPDTAAVLTVQGLCPEADGGLNPTPPRRPPARPRRRRRIILRVLEKRYEVLNTRRKGPSKGLDAARERLSIGVD
jgi:hypothetical protein